MADRHDKDYENEPDSAYYEEPFTLEYVLRGRSTQSRISSSIRATPWWMVSIALHLAAATSVWAAVALLALLVFTQGRRVDAELADA